MTHSQNQKDLSPTGMIRKSKMLDELQESMTAIHHRRRLRKMYFRVGSTIIVLLAACTWFLSSALSNPEKQQNLVVDLDKERVGIEKIDRDLHSTGQPNNTQPPDSLPLIANANNAKSLSYPNGDSRSPLPRKSLVEKYVVTTAQVEKREMESIDDAEMLDLLKQAGVEGWIAEIDDQQVVLNQNGKRL